MMWPDQGHEEPYDVVSGLDAHLEYALEWT